MLEINDNKASDEFEGAAQHIEIGVFIPPAEDSSNIVINELAEMLVSGTNSINLRIFRTKQVFDERIDLDLDLQKKNFLHGDVINDVIFPLQRKYGLKNSPSNILLCPELLQEKYKGRIFIEEVDDVNNPAFIQKSIKDNKALRMAVSVKNLSIFHDNIINAFAEKGEATLLNSHPAILPNTRGLEGPFWSRMQGLNEYTTTLHVIVRAIDAGAIINYKTVPVNGDVNKPVTNFTRNIAPKVAEMIYDLVHLRFVRNGNNPGLTVQEGEATYHTIPTSDEIKKAKDKGIIMVDSGEQIQWLLSNYANQKENPEQHAELIMGIMEEYNKFKNAPKQEHKQTLLKEFKNDNNMPTIEERHVG